MARSKKQLLEVLNKQSVAFVRDQILQLSCILGYLPTIKSL